MIKTIALICLVALLGRSHAQEPNCAEPATCDCPDVVEEVCGADGKLYKNSCEASCKGVWTCGPGPDCTLPCDPPADWDFFTCETLPHYWKCMAEDFGIDICRIGFNITEGQWYIDGEPSCIGWGELGDDTCPFDVCVCAGLAEGSYGFGMQQMAAIQATIAANSTTHQLCPVCPMKPGFVQVCHDGESYFFPVQQNNHGQDFTTPGSMDLTGRATYVTCDCEEIHRGHPLEEGGYWWDTAAQAGLDPALVTHYGGVWYYNGKYTCVGKGLGHEACDPMTVMCFGDDGETFGAGLTQLEAVLRASELPSGEYDTCPV